MLSGNASGVKARKHPAWIDSLSHALRQARHTFTSTDIVPSPPTSGALHCLGLHKEDGSLFSEIYDVNRAKFFKWDRNLLCLFWILSFSSSHASPLSAGCA